MSPQEITAALHELSDRLNHLARQVGQHIAACPPPPPAPPCPDLSERHRQVLAELLTGRSEKQIASQLGVSRHTVHVYIKKLHKVYQVSSRCELLSLWIAPESAAVLLPIGRGEDAVAAINVGSREDSRRPRRAAVNACRAPRARAHANAKAKCVRAARQVAEVRSSQPRPEPLVA
jgi:DNA-binding CsgD family transcriptional regulator